MKRLSAILVLVAAAPLAHAELKLFACEPDWASLAEAIGGDLVDADSATTALQDPHYIQARPSLIAKVRNADLVVCSGAQLEIGWLPMLLQKANNPRVMPGSPGFLETSSLVLRLGATANVDRARGDIHPQGNPHVQSDARNVGIIAKALAERMAALDPAHAAAYAAGLADFSRRWDESVARWEQKAAPLRGKRAITHHQSWVYLENWLGIVEVANLEPVPGLPPTATHLSELVAGFGDDGADFIIRAPYQDDRPSVWLSERTGIPAVLLPLSVGGTERAVDLFTLFDDIIDRLLEVLPQ